MCTSRLGAPAIDTEPTPSTRASGLATFSSRILYNPGMLSPAWADSSAMGIMSLENLKMMGVLASSGRVLEIMSSLSRTSLVSASMS